MKILFVYSLYQSNSFLKPLKTPEEINFGVSYIASLLKKKGHETRLVVLTSTFFKKSINLIDKYIKEFRPEIIGFSSISSEYPFIVEIANYVSKHYPNIYRVVGGNHVSLNPNDAISNPFHAICIGEGEYPMLELVSQLENGIQPSNIENMWIKSCEIIEKNSIRPFLDDLDSLPFPDRDIWFDWIEDRPNARFSILIGRGCPFSCSYCSNHALRKIAKGKYVRFRSPDRILDEIRYLHQNFPEKQNYFFEVETFNVNKEWTFELCQKLKEFNASLNKPLVFGTNFRIDKLMEFDSFFSAFAKANIRNLIVGVESGNERLRKKILRRDYTNKQIILLVKCARKYELNITFQNMIGIPEETEQDFMETININRICQPDSYFLNIFYPYPGTALDSLCKEKGLVKRAIDNRMERSNPVLELPDFPIKRIKKCCIWFHYNVYKGKKSLIKLYIILLRDKLFYFSPIYYKKIINLHVLRIAKTFFSRIT